MDQKNFFLDRVAALKVARSEGQLVRKTPPEDQLFSEDLY